MASMVAKGCSSNNHVPTLASIQEKGSRNKRKFRADPPLVDPSKLIPSALNECPSYEFTAERYEISPGHGQAIACDLCGISQDRSDGLKLDLGLSNAVGLTEVGPSRHKEEIEGDEFHDADWSDLTESQLEELVLNNLDTIFKSAIKKIVAYGYTEEVATRAVLRSDLCYGCKDTVSNIVDNTLAFLRSGQEIHSSKEHYFDNLQQLEKYILAELVCALREVRPFFSTGDAMWCLLICDMNVSHACSMDGDPLSSLLSEGASNGSSSTPIHTHMKADNKSSELNVPCPCKPVPSLCCSHACQPEPPTFGASRIPKSKNSMVLRGVGSEKENTNSLSDAVDSKTFSMAGPSHVLEEKFVTSRKAHSGSTKREYILRQKSLHLEKNYRTYGSKGSSRAGKLSGLGSLLLDKKLKSVSDSASVNIKSASLNISKAMGVEVPPDNGNQNLSPNPGPSPASTNLESVSTISALAKTNITAALPLISTQPVQPAIKNPPLSTADTELSLSLTSKKNSSPVFVNPNAETPYSNCTGIPNDKSLGQWMPHDKKDELILKLVPRMQELQNQLQEWTEWANQKVMQAARRLSKDRSELKTLRQEKEEVERLRKEKMTLEDNTLKKLAEMENALRKASGQVERSNATLRRLEVENSALMQDMESAKLSASESAASCQEVSKREKKILIRFQSWEKQKTLFQEELMTEKRKAANMLQELEQVNVLHEQIEARWQQEKKAKEELLIQASSIRKEREQNETSAKSRENLIKMKADTNLQRYKNDIQKLEKEISQLRLKTDSSKIAALRRGIDGSYAGKLTDSKNGQGRKDAHHSRYISEMMTNFYDLSGTESVKRDRECVMCLSEEMSVVFLPCAHQVVCKTCNELHEKQGMKDCPSCRSLIQQRIPVRYARS